MINKLRKKFILYALLSVFALLVVTLTTINLVNFGMIGSDADRVTQMIAENPNEFQQGDMGQQGENNGGGPGGPGRFGPDSPETASSTRYFTVSFDTSGNATVKVMKISAIDQDTAITWATELYNQNAQTGWYKVSYRYRIHEDVNNAALTNVTVIDYARELTPTFNVLWGSIIGGVTGTLLSFIILIFVSKGLVKPLEEADKKQKRFIADASFNLKTPLTVIAADNETNMLDQGETEASKSIEKQVKIMDNIVTHLNDLAVLEELREPEKRETFDFSAMAKTEVQNYQEIFRRANKELEVEVADGLTLAGDVTMMKRMLDEILDNAVKFTKNKAKIVIQGNEGRVTVEERNEFDGEAGPLDMVFERFYRLYNAKEENISGNGIGLSVVREIVKIHGGRVNARCEAGQFVIKAEL